MQAALALAQRGLGRTSDNPSVGCIIVRDGRVLGRGVTGLGGRPHAEPQALAQARTRFGEDAPRGATAYVTLEPCAHFGKTPPCADALVEAGVARIVAPFSDPDPRVSGKGFARLSAAGIEVKLGIEKERAGALLNGYFHRRAAFLPSVTLKLASTLDGRIATASGESQWITSPLARRYAHMLRAQSDAILVGSGTALTDDPRLDVRIAGLETRSPVRIVADRRLRLTASARILDDAPRNPVWVFGERSSNPERAEELEQSGAVLVDAPPGSNVSSMLTAFAERGIGTLFCEGGGGMAAALLREGCVDRLIIVYAGLTIGQEGLAGIGPLALERLGDAPKFEFSEARRLGVDLLTIWHPAEKGGAA